MIRASPYALSINYPSATSVTQSGIPTGSVCTVAEGTRTDVTGYTWGAPIYTGNPATIAVKGDRVHGWCPEPDHEGPGLVEGHEVGDGDVPPNFSQTFHFTVTCTNDPGEPVCAVDQLSVGDVGHPVP